VWAAAQAHCPLVQAKVVAHALPQAPQLPGSLPVLAQNGAPPSAPPHIMVPAAHVDTQTAPVQAVPAGQTWPHVPQLASSVPVLAQKGAPPSLPPSPPPQTASFIGQ